MPATPPPRGPRFLTAVSLSARNRRHHWHLCHHRVCTQPAVVATAAIAGEPRLPVLSLEEAGAVGERAERWRPPRSAGDVKDAAIMMMAILGAIALLSASEDPPR